jgi:hypothetical protein
VAHTADPPSATVAPVAEASSDALGVTYLEMHLVTGHPRLIEANARTVDMIGHLVHLAVGSTSPKTRGSDPNTQVVANGWSDSEK